LTKRQFRKFETKPAKPQDESEVGFELGDKTYLCKPDIQGAVILEFIAAAEGGTSGAAAKILPFFEEIMPEDEHEKFQEHIKSPKEIVELELLSDIVGYVIEQYTDRPTLASETSEDGS
jgi:hypothetical protein